MKRKSKNYERKGQWATIVWPGRDLIKGIRRDWNKIAPQAKRNRDMYKAKRRGCNAMEECISRRRGRSSRGK